MLRILEFSRVQVDTGSIYLRYTFKVFERVISGSGDNERRLNHSWNSCSESQPRKTHAPVALLWIKSPLLSPSNNDVNSHRIDQRSVPFGILIFPATNWLFCGGDYKIIIQRRWTSLMTSFMMRIAARHFSKRMFSPSEDLFLFSWFLVVRCSMCCNMRLTRRAFKLANIGDVLQQGCGFAVGLGLGIVALFAQRRK